MPARTPAQHARRRRVEAWIRLAAPAMNLVLALGDRLSRVAGQGDVEPEPARHPRPPIGGSARQG
jgi:hypothetical protein